MPEALGRGLLGKMEAVAESAELFGFENGPVLAAELAGFVVVHPAGILPLKLFSSPGEVMMQISSMPESMHSSPIICTTGLASPSRSTRGNISFWTALEAGYWRVPRPAAVMTALRTLAMGRVITGG